MDPKGAKKAANNAVFAESPEIESLERGNGLFRGEHENQQGSEFQNGV